MIKVICAQFFLFLTLFPAQIISQTTTPDYFWDFTQITNLNGYDYVFEQNTKDDRLAYGITPPRQSTCTSQNGNQMTYPQPGPDGVQFRSYTDSMRLQNAASIGHGQKFQVAYWIKMMPLQLLNNTQIKMDLTTHPFFGASSELTIIKLWSNELYFFGSLRSQFINYADEILKVTQGWYLVSIAMDSTSNQNTYVTIRTRGAYGVYDTVYTNWVNWVMSESAYGTQNADLYIGGYCVASSGNGQYYNGAIFTMGKKYFWKNYANINDDAKFDRFFFRKNGQYTASNALFITPTCQGSVSCPFCVVGYPFPSNTNNNMTLNCTTASSNNQSLYFVYWDFDNANNTQTSQFILDLSGNGNHLQKNPVNQVGSNEIFRIYGQGVMFYNAAWIMGVQKVPFDKSSQFTFEVWYRKIIDNNPWANPTRVSTAAPLIIYDPVANKNQDILTLSDSVKRSWYCFRNCSDATTFNQDSLLQTNQWTFFSLSMMTYQYWQGMYCYTFRHQIDSASYLDYKNYTTGEDQYPIPETAEYHLGINDETIMYKSIKIFKYAKYSNDDGDNTVQIKKRCLKVGNQAQCNVCPYETGQCLSMCNENQYGPNCSNCHSFCGHCTGATKNDCVYCSRNVTLASVIFSQTFGNCSCISGMYYNSTSDSCQNCHLNCRECFGYNYNQCYTCKISSVYFPNTICANNCSDPFIVNGSKTQGYYSSSEQSLSMIPANVNTCYKCHPYCNACTGPNNTQCSSCNNGSYLNAPSTCLNTCPSNQYPENKTNQCTNCHIDCLTCSGPNNTQCLSCTDPTKYLQTGSCQVACNSTYFPDSSKVCNNCDPACATCTGIKTTQCETCNNGYYLQWLSTTCKTTCPDGQYPDPTTNSCLLCHYSCKTCTDGGPDKCLTCASSLLKSGTYCVTSCADTQFVLNGVCSNCDSMCNSCFGPSSAQCYSCNSNIRTGLGYYYFNQSCSEVCPVGYHPNNVRNTCDRCSSVCASCTSQTYCTSCIIGPYQLNSGECTYFSCLDTEYRAVTPNLACYKCDSSCSTCQGQSQFDCLTCRPQDEFQAQQCLSCDQQPGMTFPLDDSINGCVEICGDGFNYGFYQCDDGNNINGDGCSSKCTIENGFNCTTGNKLSPSICMDDQNPTPKIQLVTAENTIYIQFDEEVYLQQTIDESNVQITVSGPQGTYKFDWMLGDDYRTSEAVQIIAFDLSFYTSLKGSQKEQVTVQFLTDQVYKDATGNGMVTIPLTAYLNQYEYIDPATKAKLESASDTSIYATYGVVVINLLISQLFGGSIAAMWTMVNTIQLISLLPLCNVNYPTIVVLVLQKMLSSQGESTAIPNVFYTALFGSTSSNVKLEKPLNDRFRSYGWPISNFLYLSGRKILLWMLLIFIYPLVWYMKQKYADKHKLCRKWVDVEQKFRYTLLLRGVIMSYVSMYLAFMLGIVQMSLSSLENVISAFAAMAFGIILTFLPMHLMNILQRNYEIIKSKKFMDSYSTIIKEVDLSHPIKYMYYPVFLIRRGLFAISLVIFANQPKEQIIVMSLTAFAMIIYVCVIRPQNEKVMIILTAFGECLLLFLHSFSVVFLNDNLSDSQASMYGWIMLVAIGLYMIINWVVIIRLTIGQLKSNWRESKIKKIEIKNKLEEDKQYRRWKKKMYIKQQMEKEEDRQKFIDSQEDQSSKYQHSRMRNQMSRLSLINVTNLSRKNKSSSNVSGNQFSPNLKYNQTQPYPFGVIESQTEYAEQNMVLEQNSQILDQSNESPFLKSQIVGTSNALMSQKNVDMKSMLSSLTIQPFHVMDADDANEQQETPNIFGKQNKFLFEQIAAQQQQQFLPSFNNGEVQDHYKSSFQQLGNPNFGNEFRKSPKQQNSINRYKIQKEFSIQIEDVKEI